MLKPENGRMVPVTNYTERNLSKSKAEVEPGFEEFEAVVSHQIAVHRLFGNDFTFETMDPASKSGRVVHFDAEEITPQVHDTILPTWNDESGNGFNATATGGNEPRYHTNVIGSLPGVRVQDPDFMSLNGAIATLNGLTEWTVIAAVRGVAPLPGETAVDEGCVLSLTDASDNNSEIAVRLGHQRDNSNNSTLGSQSPSVIAREAGSAVFNTGVKIASKELRDPGDYGTVLAFRSKQSIDQFGFRSYYHVDTQVAWGDSNSCLPSDVNDIDNVTLGTRVTSGGNIQNFNGYLFEIVVYNSFIENIELIKMINFLRNKWFTPIPLEKSPLDLRNDLLAWWDVNELHNIESIADRSGNGHTWISLDPAPTTTENNKQVLQFNGSSDHYVNLTLGQAVKNLDEFSAFFIVNNDIESDGAYLLYVLDDDSVSERSFALEYHRVSGINTTITIRSIFDGSEVGGCPDELPSGFSAEYNFSNVTTEPIMIVYNVSATADADGHKSTIWVQNTKIAGSTTQHSFSHNGSNFNKAILCARKTTSDVVDREWDGRLYAAGMFNRGLTTNEIRGMFLWYERVYWSNIASMPNFFSIPAGNYQVKVHTNFGNNGYVKMLLERVCSNQGYKYETNNVNCVLSGTIMEDGGTPIFIGRVSLAEPALFQIRYVSEGNADQFKTNTVTTKINYIELVEEHVSETVVPVLHFDASSGTSDIGGELTGWADDSHLGNELAITAQSANVTVVNNNVIMSGTSDEMTLLYPQLGIQFAVFVIKQDGDAATAVRKLFENAQGIGMWQSPSDSQVILDLANSNGINNEAIFKINNVAIDPEVITWPTDLSVLSVEYPVNMMEIDRIKGWDGNIAEIKLFKDNLSSSQKSSEISSLMTKWGIS